MRFGLLKGILPLTGGSILRDAIAGLTLASMNIPQVLGYARIAGMPAVTGLYTVLLPLIAFAVFGASRHLVVAADSATATIMSARLGTMASIASPHYVALASMVALLTGVLLLLARVFKLGFLADFLSRTVLVGFLAGVGIQIGSAMLGDMFGLAISASRTVGQIRQVVDGLSSMHSPTLVLATVVVTCVLLGKRFAPRFPVGLLCVVSGIALSRHFNWVNHGITTMGPVLGGLPQWKFPHVTWQETVALLPVAGSCFVMIIAQSAAASRAFAERHNEQVDINADILGLAISNVSAAVSGTFVVNGSPTQTAMADIAGARSQVAQLVFAGAVVLVLLFVTGALQYLPHAVLAAIVFTIAIGLIDLKTLWSIRRESIGEFGLACVTAAAVILIGVEQGILISVALSLVRHVRHSYRPHTMVLSSSIGGKWLPVPAAPGLQTAPGLIVYRFGADLFFANDHLFVDEVHRLVDHAPSPVTHLVIDAGAITDLDYSAARSLTDLCKSLEQRAVELSFGRVNIYLQADMERHGIVALVGANRLFSTLHEALSAVQAAPELVNKTAG